MNGWAPPKESCQTRGKGADPVSAPAVAAALSSREPAADRPPRTISNRRGVILVIVLIVIGVLALACYSFARLMLAHSESTHIGGRRVQAEMLAASGVDWTRAFLQMDRLSQLSLGGLVDNPTQFQAILMLEGLQADEIGRFTVLSPPLHEGGDGQVRYGLQDESGKINLNTLMMIEQQATELADQGLLLPDLDFEDSELFDDEDGDLFGLEHYARNLLLGLPGMTVEVADAILDWLDEDDEPREFGAEIEHYSSLTPPYAPKNGPLETVEELLLVRGVTPELLFGGDINRNGMVDAHESTMTAGFDGFPGTGWASYFTLHSKERNVNFLGEPRINLNQDDLLQLYEELSLVFPQEWVTFIIAYRQNGPYAEGDEGGRDEDEDEEIQILTPEMYADLELDLERSASTELVQVLDLIGQMVQVTLPGDEEPSLLISPFPDDVVSMGTYMVELMDEVTVVDRSILPGRISLSQAPREVLLGIPGMSEEIVEQILNQRVADPWLDAPHQRHETWLLTDGIVTLDQMRALIPFVCGVGDVYSAQVVGYYDDGRAAARLEVILDATESVPRVLLWRDITHLGRGYSLETLGVPLGDGM